MKKEAFSERLGAIIKERNIKQVDLCRQTGIRKSAMSQYLRGAFDPKQENLHALAKALNVSEAWLMGYDVPRSRWIENPDNTATDSVSEDFFYHQVSDDSMMDAHIPEGALVRIQRQSDVEHGNIVFYSLPDGTSGLRTFYQDADSILLMASTTQYPPLVFKTSDLADGTLKILGVAVQVLIDLV